MIHLDAMMDELYRELQETALTKYNEIHKDKIESNRAFDARLNHAILDMANMIMIGAIDRMRSESAQGQFSCVLYECTSRENFNDEFRSLYVLRGPGRWNGLASFFERKGLVSVVKRLNELLNPIDVYLRYDRLTSNTLVCAAWKTT